MAEQDFDVLCSFCDQKFTSQEDMRDHLMMCGNKTDECPNCRKYVRRAIFAYHYENDCANPDAPTTDDQPYQPAQHLESAPVTIQCKHCQQNYDRADRKVHKKNCPGKPANREKNQRSSNDENLNQNPDRSRQSNDSDDEDALIPCEWCNKGISLHLYQKHAEACREEEHKRLEKRARRTSQNTVPVADVDTSTYHVIERAPCMFCKLYMSLKGLSYHQLHCTKNARRNKN